MDPGQLNAEQKRFIAEALKRRRPDDVPQLQKLRQSEDERLRMLGRDPWADHAALDSLPQRLKHGDKIKFAIVGAGFGGLLAAVRLLQQGFTSDQIRIVEAAGGVGGVWYWNRFPGLHCDNESYVYLPLLEETGYMPRKKYVSGTEIRQYAAEIVRQWGLEDCIVYRTQLKHLQWEDTTNTWAADLEQTRGSGGSEKHTLSINAEFVFLTIGMFIEPQAPNIPDLASFEGQMLHTARWDYSITGGSKDETFPALDKLQEKRVGVIGTAATTIQVVPELAKYAREVFVFQRTPASIHARNQRDTDPTDWKEHIAAEKGWHQRRIENFAAHLSAGAPLDHLDLVNDELSRMKTTRALWGGEGFACRPCYDGRDYAPCPHNGCVEQVTPEMVLGEVERLLRCVRDGEQRLPEVKTPAHTALVRLAAAEVIR